MALAPIRWPGVLTTKSGRQLNHPDVGGISRTVHASCGPTHCAFVYSNGLAYTLGCNDRGQLGLGGDVASVGEPTLVTTLASTPVCRVACGRTFTLFVAGDGQLFACGADPTGQLGLGPGVEVATPVAVPGLPSMGRVAVGGGHTVALCRAGNVWVAGFNAMGQTGLVRRENRTAFVKIPGLAGPFVEVSCGLQHTALLSESGDVYLAGSNEFGQLGFGLLVMDGFQRLPLPFPFKSISCGLHHTMAVTRDGRVLAWGRNKQGQLGTGDAICQLLPAAVAVGVHKILKVVAGGNRSALLSSGGDVLLSGRGAYRPSRSIRSPSIGGWRLVQKSSGLTVTGAALGSAYTVWLVERKPAEGDVVTSITSLEKNVLRLLECAVCFEYMSSPIHMCTGGHSFCRPCRVSSDICYLCREPYIPGRNVALESMAAVANLPCPDCHRRMTVPLLRTHWAECPRRHIVCPLVEPTCRWSGPSELFSAHALSAHADQTWANPPRLVVHSVSESNRTDLLLAHGQAFALHRRYTQTQATKCFSVCARRVGGSHLLRHQLRVEFVADDVATNVVCVAKVGTDLQLVDHIFILPQHRVFLEARRLDPFLRDDHLVCRVDILVDDVGGP